LSSVLPEEPELPLDPELPELPELPLEPELPFDPELVPDELVGSVDELHAATRATSERAATMEPVKRESKGASKDARCARRPDSQPACLSARA
jgi:hypothetical protein